MRIKWPNDLVLDGKKIVGILNEVSCGMDSVEYVVLGVGLNVRRAAVPPELADSAGCLEDRGEPPKRREILCAYLERLEGLVRALEDRGMAALADDYRAYSCTLGRQVRVLSPAGAFTGVALDMDATGALLVQDMEGTVRRVLAGDVSVRGVMGYV